MKQMKTRYAKLALAIAASLSATGAYAQQQEDEAALLEPVLDTVMVTAQKRPKSLQDVSVSVAVISGDRLVEQGIDNLDDLAQYVPNFSKGESGAGPIIRIRGIATGSNPAFEQSVVLFADDIPLSRAPLARIPFMDLERVEVVRGPQNVLFGKNAIAGAISFISAKPTDEFEAKVSLRYEPEYDDSEAVAVVSGPVSDNLRARLAVRSAEYGGYFEKFSNQTGNDQLKLRDEEQREDFAIRGTLGFDIGDYTEVTFRAEHDSVDSDGQGHELIFGYANPFPASAANPLGGLNYTQSVAAIQGAYNAVITGFGLPPVDVGTDTINQDRIRRSAFDGYQNLDVNKFDLTINHQFDGFTMTSVTGYVEYEEDRLAGGGLSGIDISSILTKENYDQFSQEIRFTSDKGGTFDWIAGLYFQDWNLDADESTLLDDMNLPVLLGIAGAAPGLESVANLNSTRTFSSDSTTYAGFGEVTWNISDAARLSFGARYTIEDKDAVKTVDIINRTTGQFDVTQAIFASCAFGVDYQSLGALSSVAPLPGCDGVVAIGAYNTHNTRADRSENAFTPSLTAEFDVNDSNMLYATASKGFKAGGFDARAARQSNLEYEDESVIGVEFGLKSRFADGRAETNISAFHSSYDDLQVTTFDGVAGFVVGNAAEFTSRGIEFEGRWLATNSLTLSGSLAWTDTEFDKYENTTCNSLLRITTGQQLCDRTGLSANNTPEWSGNFIADYTTPLGASSMYFRATLEAFYSGEYFTETTREVGTKQDSYTKFNLRLALEGEQWSLALLGKNLTDETVIDFSSEVPLSGANLAAPAYYGYLQPPRTIAVQFDYNF